MPAYYSVFITLKEFYPNKHPPLISIYNAFLTNDFEFDGKYPTKDKKSGKDYWSEWEGYDEWESIISWNQERLNRNFKLGWTQHWKEGYQQFLLKHPLYSHCRVITSSDNIMVIVPEKEITLPKFEWYKGNRSVSSELIKPLKELSLSVWSTGVASSIQTVSELGYYIRYKKLVEGTLPSMCPFAIVDKSLAKQIWRLHLNCLIREEKLSTGVLLTSSESIL